MIVELCTDGLIDFKRIEGYGINRIELCSALSVGGLSPSSIIAKHCFRSFAGDTYCMIRPRSGDFNYSLKEIDLMRKEIDFFGALGIKGVVFGVLDEHSRIDQKKTKSLVLTAKDNNLRITFHRAFDLTNDLDESVQKLSDLKVDYLLTSGMRDKAVDGKDNIKEIIKHPNRKFQVIAGSGVNTEQVEVWKELGVDGIHFTARKKIKSMELGMGDHFEADFEKIEKILGRL